MNNNQFYSSILKTLLKSHLLLHLCIILDNVYNANAGHKDKD